MPLGLTPVHSYCHGWWLEIRRATATKRRAQNKPLARHPARGLNLRHTNQETHDATWFDARGLKHDQCRPFLEVHHYTTHVIVAHREKNGRIYTTLTTKLLTLSRGRGRRVAENKIVR